MPTCLTIKGPDKHHGHILMRDKVSLLKQLKISKEVSKFMIAMERNVIAGFSSITAS
jgi:hypothetical protein